MAYRLLLDSTFRSVPAAQKDGSLGQLPYVPLS